MAIFEKIRQSITLEQLRDEISFYTGGERSSFQPDIPTNTLEATEEHPTIKPAPKEFKFKPLTKKEKTFDRKHVDMCEDED